MLVAAVLAGGCGGPAADLLLVGGHVVTLDSTASAATTIAIRNGRIAAVGDSTLVARWEGNGTRMLDLHGATVAPAFVDHHVHLFDVGYTLLNDESHGRLLLDLTGVTSLDEVLRMVQARADSVPAGGWVLGAGWSQAAWGTQSLPGNDVLNRAAPTTPVYLARIDGHAGWANRAALERAGLWAAAPDPPGGTIPRRQDGTPLGVLLERANEPMVALVPPPADSDVIHAFQLAAAALAARGVVTVYDAGVLPPPGIVALDADLLHYLALLRRADSAAPLPLEINLMIPAPSALADSVLAWPPARRVISPRIRITHLKLFADGALGSRGAALTHPYADDPGTSGVPRMTADEIADLTRRALDAGLGVATHAIGDEAVKRTLDAYQRVLADHPGLNPRRLRIEHFSYAREPDFARAVKLGIVLSIQSNFNSAPTDHPTFGAMRVGAANDDRVYAWDRLHRMGAPLAEGSDYFTRPGGPLAGFLATLTLKGTVGERRPDSEARRLAWSMNATYFPPDGAPVDPTIRAGAPANLVVLSADPFTVPRTALPEIQVQATIGGGAVRYAARAFPQVTTPP